MVPSLAIGIGQNKEMGMGSQPSTVWIIVFANGAAVHLLTPARERAMPSLRRLANARLGGITYKRLAEVTNNGGLMIKGLISLALGSVFVSATAFAQSTDTPVIDQRMQNQEQRVEKGIDSGRLTEREANRMNRHLDRIENAEAKAKADGKVTRRERRRLNRALDHNSRAIHEQKHDRQHQ
jgi:hypothetical protein